jgi:hypothetical protein
MSREHRRRIKEYNRILSVDWDYFFPDMAWMDWGHNESAMLIEHVWMIRCNDFNMKTRESVLDCMKPDPMLLDNFWERTIHPSSKFDLLIEESHAGLAKYLSDKDCYAHEVDNFDQHHDCGYGDMDRDSHVDCGEWAAYLANVGRMGRYTVHYPPWRANQPERSRAELRRRMGKFGGWNYKLPTPKIYDMVFICRSGGWTPPWTDNLFGKFAQELVERVHNDNVIKSWIWPKLRKPTMEEAIQIREKLIEQHRMMMQQMKKRISETIISPSNRERQEGADK